MGWPECGIEHQPSRQLTWRGLSVNSVYIPHLPPPSARLLRTAPGKPRRKRCGRLLEAAVKDMLASSQRTNVNCIACNVGKYQRFSGSAEIR
jgi:hypothetical protein